MTSRRKFLNQGFGLMGVSFLDKSNFFSKSNKNKFPKSEIFVSKRPELKDRMYFSLEVENLIKEVKTKIKSPKLAWLFENCFPNTLDTTAFFSEINKKPDTFIITGDIHAMWLRDSTAQLWPYLPLCEKDVALTTLFKGLINRQTKCVLLDPYANAFNENGHAGEVYHDITDLKPGIHERKWEIDSLCYPIRLAYGYWKTSSDHSVFDEDWGNSVRLIVNTFRDQQRKKSKGPYHFQRETAVQSDTVALSGYGNPILPNGLICSSFRPSDDATLFSFLIPSNLFAKKCLEYLAEMAEFLLKDLDFKKECLAFSQEIGDAVQRYGIYDHPKCGKLFAYEVDGFGNQVLMDDANVPSLLSLPYLNLISKDDPIYKNTRDFIWSPKNPYFFMGSSGEGIGGPHVGLDFIWPMSLLMKSLTTDSESEIVHSLEILMKSDAGTGFMHESFHKDNVNDFTRKWFAWVNSLFGELVVKIYQKHPHIFELIQ